MKVQRSRFTVASSGRLTRPPARPPRPPARRQIPIGLEEALRGLVDLVDRKAYVFEGASGQHVTGVRAGERAEG